MNHVLRKLIHDTALKDAQMARPGRSLPALLSFASPVQPDQEIRDLYQMQIQAVQIIAGIRAVHAQLVRYREEIRP